ncbi:MULTISPECIES: signal peptidase I [Sutcliffiella]|uniref:signal peptidase I n=1 Tax=Sutcliffiella TaxID=2837511 RepID=UPI0022DCFA05|nr:MULTISPECIES: signal peptidase I [Sutcliffiella]MED4018780.1 signal peptidase I [Sutcliffiella cohnii]WBL16989.1 signal peptidase I [Sutcliffiella sp. NC1]
MKKLLLILSIILLTACSSALTNKTITDSYTKEKLEKVEMKDGMITIYYRSDNMERGDNPYNYLLRDIVIDPSFYDNEEIQRGDVVYHEQPKEYYELVQYEALEEPLNRVIALPGESVEIKDGQFYIDGKKLDTFYGNGTNNIRSNDYESEFQLEKITVPDGHIFVSGDLWWRGIDSKQYGPIPIEFVKGKVLGYP